MVKISVSVRKRSFLVEFLVENTMEYCITLFIMSQLSCCDCDIATFHFDNVNHLKEVSLYIRDESRKGHVLGFSHKTIYRD